MKRTTLITGASKGIGKAIANKFLQEGYRVIGLDVLDGSIDNENYTHYICDVSDKGTFPKLEHRCNVIVNNAGTDLNETSISVNLEGAINITEHYFDMFETTHICNICSTSAHNGAEYSRYAASKGGLLAYTKNCALEYGQTGTIVNSISPGAVETDMNESVINDKYKYKEISGESILGKWAMPEEVADLCFFLCSDSNMSITGQDIIIDNGETAKVNFII